MEPSTDLLWDMFSKTALVLVLIYGALWSIKRFSGKVEADRRGPSIQLMHTATLGAGRSVHLLGVGDRLILVGATSQQVSLLADLGSMEADALGAAGGSGGRSGGGFERYFRQAMQTFDRLPYRLSRHQEGATTSEHSALGASR